MTHTKISSGMNKVLFVTALVAATSTQMNFFTLQGMVSPQGADREVAEAVRIAIKKNLLTYKDPQEIRNYITNQVKKSLRTMDIDNTRVQYLSTHLEEHLDTLLENFNIQYANFNRLVIFILEEPVRLLEILAKLEKTANEEVQASEDFLEGNIDSFPARQSTSFAENFLRKLEKQRRQDRNLGRNPSGGLQQQYKDQSYRRQGASRRQFWQ